MTPRSQRHEWYSERSHEDLVQDAMEAFTRIESLELKVWVLGGALVGALGLNAWLGTALLDCLRASHTVAAVLR